jgi:hypothetical protein
MRFLLSSILSLAALAAGYYRISGIVTDQTGAPVPDATVEISGGMDQPKRLQSDTTGRFASTPLPSGTYTLSVTRSGFAPQRLPVSLSDKDSALKIVLPLATQAYSVTVEGRTSSLDTSSAAHQDAFILDQQMLADLPVKDGDILSALSSFVNPAGGAAPTVIVDGMERTDAELPLSSIQQVRVNNNAYSAEFPKPGKDRIEIDTKGGDDTFHGGFIVRARNAIFDARNPMADEKPPFSRYGYEANLSGPVPRKRLWFFLDANGTATAKPGCLRLSPVRNCSDGCSVSGHARQPPWKARLAGDESATDQPQV